MWDYLHNELFKVYTKFSYFLELIWIDLDFFLRGKLIVF
jgi:hypothetical protein